VDYDPESIYERTFLEKIQKASKTVELFADKPLNETLVVTEMIEGEE